MTRKRDDLKAHKLAIMDSIADKDDTSLGSSDEPPVTKKTKHDHSAMKSDMKRKEADELEVLGAKVEKLMKKHYGNSEHYGSVRGVHGESGDRPYRED